jgi:ribosomal protein S18 acetylase RimI-like enzyme
MQRPHEKFQTMQCPAGGELLSLDNLDVMVDCMPIIRRLSTCSLEEAVQIWNEGFKGYFVDVTLSLDAYVARLYSEGISPEYSFIAFSAGKPAGCLLNGIRINAGRKVAWNGGTAVNPDFRGQGIGKVLVKAALELYAEEGVEVATLEAISANISAIALYQQAGYEIVDHLLFLQSDRAIRTKFSHHCNNDSYSIRSAPPAVVAGLAFYESSAPWQTQWQSVLLKNGAALIIADGRGEALGYSLYKKTFDQEGKVAAIVLYQCAAAPGKPNAESIVACALEEVYAPLDAECHRSTHNLSKKNEVVCRLLTEAGFTPFAEQVHMAKILKGSSFAN